MSRIQFAATLCALGWLASCNKVSSPPPIDPAMAACVPGGTIAVAGVNLEQLRASQLFPNLPFLEPFHDARSLLAAYSGKDLLIAASRGSGAPPSLTGSPDAVRAAQAQQKTGKSGEPGLLDQAGSFAGGNDIWAIVRGNVTLPLTGNAANLNRLLRNMEFAGVTLRAGSTVELGVSARGLTAEAARHFEETLRATLTMTAAAEARQADLAGLLRAVKIRRDDRMVRAAITASPETARKLLQAITPQ